MSTWRAGGEVSSGRTIPVTVTEISLLVTPRMLSEALASESKGPNEKHTDAPEERRGKGRKVVKKQADPSN